MKMKPNVFTVPQAFMRLFLDLQRKENLMMKPVTCLVYLHRLHETVASYIANAEDKNIATEIGNCYNFHRQLSNIICFPNNNATNTN